MEKEYKQMKTFLRQIIMEDEIQSKRNRSIAVWLCWSFQYVLLVFLFWKVISFVMRLIPVEPRGSVFNSIGLVGGVYYKPSAVVAVYLSILSFPCPSCPFGPNPLTSNMLELSGRRANGVRPTLSQMLNS